MLIESRGLLDAKLVFYLSVNQVGLLFKPAIVTYLLSFVSIQSHRFYVIDDVIQKVQRHVDLIKIHVVR